MTQPRGRRFLETHKEGVIVLTEFGKVRLFADAENDLFEDVNLAGYSAKLPFIRKVRASPANNRSRLSVIDGSMSDPVSSISMISA